jgi:hypothetical protein
VTLDYDRIRDRVLREAERGLQMSLDQMAVKAKHYAPVRDVFRHGSTHASPQKVPRGIQSRKRYVHKQRVFGRRITHHTEAGRSRFMRQARAQRMKDHRMFIQTNVGPRRVSGSPTSFIPLIRDGQKATYGPLRRLTFEGGFRPASVQAYVSPDSARVIARGRVRSASSFLAGEDEGPDLRRANRLVGQASEEQVRSGLQRASISAQRALRDEKGDLMNQDLGVTRRIGMGRLRRLAVHVDAEGEMTLGGRLRDEIFVDTIHHEGDLIYGDVVSPTEYGKYQEYGSSHNRPHPYMRPALYSMRRVFAANVRRSLGRSPF